MLRIYSKNVLRLATSTAATPGFRVTSIEALPASFRNYLHVAALARTERGIAPFHPLASHWPRTASLKSNVALTRAFHASKRIEGLPLVPILLGALKSSFVLNCMQGIIRIALTLVPIALVRKHIGSKWIQKLDRYPNKYPELEAKRPSLMRKIKINAILLKVLLLVPAGLFGLVVLASLERTPLTGRMRLIVLSPDEEEGIARDLAGPGWFTAVNEVLTTSRGPPKFIPPTDWRYAWVERTLRRLESVVPTLQDQSHAGTRWLDRDATDPPYPPPPDYPLLPRPRASQRLHYLEPPNVESEHSHHHTESGAPPHSVIGPPYSLLVTDQPDQSNAFSYGFGPNGSGGVVIFSGFLDEILRNTGSTSRPRGSLLSSLSSLFSPSSSAPPVPTREQDAQLAILVAHELAHLLLSHHLETLSSESVFLPTLTSIVADLFRALLFPITMVGGPFLNDALEQVGEVGKRDFASAADSCSSHKMEIEADVVSVRLLALAGWDARNAVDFWESRVNAPLSQEMRQHAVQTQLPGVLPGALWVSQDGGVHSSSHPVDELRVRKLREELERWEARRKLALQKRAS